MQRRKFYRLARRIWVGLLLIAACDLYRPVRPIGSAFAGILTVCALPFLYGLHRNAVRDDRGIAALMANAWVHWRFSSAEWKAVADAQFPEGTAPAFSWKRNWPVGLASVMTGTVVAWIFDGRPWMILTAFVLFLLFPFACNWLRRRDTGAEHRRMMAAPAEVRMGAGGLLLGDRYTPWASSEFRLGQAAVRAAPARLMLRFDLYFTGVYSSRPYFHRAVPLPPGAGRELELLQQKLRAACPKAEIGQV